MLIPTAVNISPEGMNRKLNRICKFEKQIIGTGVNG